MPRVSSEKTEAPKRAPRRRVAKPRTASASAVAPASVSRRKSPTVLPERSASVGARRKVGTKKFVALGLMISGLALAAFIGSSDKGQIDIAAVITERNAKITAGASDVDGTGVASVIVPVQNTSNLPNGGLIPSAEQVTPPPPIVETATTSTTTASTTEEVAQTEVNDETTISINGEEASEPLTETTQAEETSI